MTRTKTKTPRKTKAALVREMLERPRGASIEEVCKATGWQSHTVRAALSGLRKAGLNIDRAKSDAGTSVYRITEPEEAGQ
jgi:transposase-like protein